MHLKQREDSKGNVHLLDTEKAQSQSNMRLYTNVIFANAQCRIY